MIFIFKKNTIQLDCFVREEFAYVAEYSPIVKASKFLPEWFKNLPNLNPKKFLDNKDIDPMALGINVKYCVGINTTLTSGFIQPLWSEMYFESNEKLWRYQFADKKSILEWHANSQTPGYVENYNIFKFNSPWIIKASKASALLTLPPIYHTGLNTPYRQLHGIYETRTKQNIFHMNTFILFKKKEVRTILPLNTPITHMIPMGGEKVEIKCHVDTREYARLGSLMNNPITFTASATASQKLVCERLKNEM